MYSLEAGVSGSGDDQQVVQASLLLRPLLGVSVQYAMASPMSLLLWELVCPVCLVAWQSLLVHHGAPRAHRCPPTLRSQGGHLYSLGKAHLPEQCTARDAGIPETLALRRMQGCQAAGFCGSGSFCGKTREV